MTTLKISQSIVMLPNSFLNMTKPNFAVLLRQVDDGRGLVKEVKDIMEARDWVQVDPVRA